MTTLNHPTCETCKWRDGEACRRHPPVPIAIADIAGETGSVDSIVPIVGLDDWCGEYKPKPDPNATFWNTSTGPR